MIYGVYGKTANLGPEPDEVPVAENFNSSYGLAEAMLESAKSDLAMFEAMLKIDAMEIKLNEANELAERPEANVALKKGTVQKIIDKIKAGIQWLVGKIKAAATMIYRKFVTLFDNDSKLINKYGKALAAQSAEVGKVKIKWFEVKKSGFDNPPDEKAFDYASAISGYKEDASERRNFYGVIESSEYIAGEAVEKSIADVGGIIKVMARLDKNSKGKLKTFATKIAKKTKDLEGLAKKMKTASDNPEDAAKAYKMFQAYKEVVLGNMRTCQAAMVKEYKQNRAALVKAIGSLSKTESCILDYLVEEAEYEVDDVFDAEIEKDPEDVTDVSAADAKVLDSGVSDDAAALTYDKVDSYSEEAASLDYFGQPLF